MSKCVENNLPLRAISKPPVKDMKYIFPIFLLFISAFSLKAGETEIEKPDDAFATWSDLIVRKDIGNWHIGGLLEYCTIDKGQGMKNDEIILRPIVGYNPLPWLRFQMQMDFLYSFSGGFYLRYLPDMTFHWKLYDLKCSFRTRMQISHHVESGKVTPVVRNRLKFDYPIPNSPVSVHIASEPYWLDKFMKTRYYIGADFQLTKQLSITADYLRYQYYDPAKPHHNVVYLTLYVRL